MLKLSLALIAFSLPPSQPSIELIATIVPSSVTVVSYTEDSKDGQRRTVGRDGKGGGGQGGTTTK